MKTRLFLLAITMLFLTVQSVFSQNKLDAKVIKLEQTAGEFTIKSLSLDQGNYIFEIANNGVDHEVGFVLAPKGTTEAADHIKDAYVQSTVENGSASSSKVVSLTPGEYEYFCPLNPTPKYTIIVK